MASLEEIRAERLKKLKSIKEAGLHPFPVKTIRDFAVSEVVAKFSKLPKSKPIFVAGRIMAIRGQGALIFFDLNDGTGTMQGMFKKGETNEDFQKLFLDTADIGDFIQIKGKPLITQRKEKTILASEWRMLAKGLRPLPDKWHGIQDVEERFRKRYLDILMSQDVKERFVLRSQIVSELRSGLLDAGFLEDETTLLQHLAGGAT